MTHFLDHVLEQIPLKHILRCQTTKRTTVSEFPATKTQNISKKNPQKSFHFGVFPSGNRLASPIKERANMLVKPRSWISAAPEGETQRPEAAEDDHGE